MQQKICSKGEYYIMNRQELFQKRRNNTILCGWCQKDNCCYCNRFNYIREQLEKNAFFERQYGPKDEPWCRQPVLWQVFDDFIKKTNNLDKNTFKFRIYIEKTVLSNFLIKKYDFINAKIIEILSFRFYYSLSNRCFVFFSV